MEGRWCGAVDHAAPRFVISVGSALVHYSLRGLGCAQTRTHTIGIRTTASPPPMKLTDNLILDLASLLSQATFRTTVVGKKDGLRAA